MIATVAITANEIAPILTHIYKSSLDQGLLPVDWKSANISPIFKKGNRAQVIIGQYH